jgi:hypothetical protein
MKGFEESPAGSTHSTTTIPPTSREMTSAQRMPAQPRFCSRHADSTPASTPLIGGVTGLPDSFVDLIVQRSARRRYRDTEAFRNLAHTIRMCEKDFSAIEDEREYAIEMFWEKTLSPADVAASLEARGSRIFGGGYQNWVDDDEVHAFLRDLEEDDVARG